MSVRPARRDGHTGPTNAPGHPTRSFETERDSVRVEAMPMMKLYFSKTSPYARKVRIAIEELGLADQVEEIVADPFAPTAELLEANPLSKVPTLVTERNEAVPDSRLILDYLSHRKSGLAALSRGAKR